MRTLKIGRSEDCQIILEDPQNLISRTHAILRFYPMGTIEIVPMGANKTYINGKEAKNGKAWKVSRKDVISFAHVKDLDWGKVPNPYAKTYKTIASAVLAILFLFVALLLLPHLNRCSTCKDNPTIETFEGGNNNDAVPHLESTDSVSGDGTKPKKVFPPSRKAKGSDTIKKADEVDNAQNEIENKNFQIF